MCDWMETYDSVCVCVSGIPRKHTVHITHTDWLWVLREFINFFCVVLAGPRVCVFAVRIFLPLLRYFCSAAQHSMAKWSRAYIIYYVCRMQGSAIVKLEHNIRILESGHHFVCIVMCVCVCVSVYTVHAIQNFYTLILNVDTQLFVVYRS